MTRIIGIVGRDFCGSTMLLRLFACVDGVEPVGELHWLVDAPVGISTRTKSGWPVSRRCIVCGEKCKVFTPEFVDSSHDNRTLYAEVAKRLEASVIVSADKMPMHYERFVNPGEMDAIVLYKTPMAQAYSDMKNEKCSLDDALLLWSRTYDHIIKWCVTTRFLRSSVFLCYEDLATNPRAEMLRLCKTLKLKAPPDDLLERFLSSQLDKRYHCIGCSPHFHRRGKIVVDKHWETALTDKQKTLCTSGQSGAVFNRLENFARTGT